jgi:hypothetical protein
MVSNSYPAWGRRGPAPLTEDLKKTIACFDEMISADLVERVTEPI